MIIKKDWKFKLRNDATQEISCEVFFRVIDSNRKVPIEVTGCIICEIKKWIKIYQEKIIPSIEPVSPRLEEEKNRKYRETIKWVDRWDYMLNSLIPENQAIIADISASDDWLYYVKKNYALLKPNQLLTYNQALFLLLGLNAVELDYSLRDFPVLDGARPSGNFHAFDFIFWNTPQNQALKSSAFVVNGKITSENLIELASTANNFFIEPKPGNEEPTEREKRVKTVKEVLISHLKNRRDSSKISIHALSENSEFQKTFSQKGLVISLNDEDEPKQRPTDYFNPRTLETYLTEIVSSPLWKDLPKNIQNKLTYTPKPKK